MAVPRHPAPRHAVLLALALSLGACANQMPTKSGFLSDYSGLTPVEKNSRTLERKPDPAALARYDSVFVEPVSTAGLAGVAPADARELATLAEAALRGALGRQWRLASAPGPRTITIRTALTNVRKANPIANVALTIVAVPLVNGGLSAEGEFLAGRASLGAITWADEGRLNPVGYYSELGHPRALTADFAAAVAAALDRGKPAS